LMNQVPLGTLLLIIASLFTDTFPNWRHIQTNQWLMLLLVCIQPSLFLHNVKEKVSRRRTPLLMINEVRIPLNPSKYFPILHHRLRRCCEQHRGRAPQNLPDRSARLGRGSEECRQRECYGYIFGVGRDRAVSLNFVVVILICTDGVRYSYVMYREQNRPVRMQ
jgi:hypothetical protein